jgi:predicted secreted protein
MANYLGRSGSLRISSTTVGELRNYSLSHSADTVEDSVIGDVYRTRKATMRVWSLSGDVFWDPVDAGQVALTIGSSVTVNLYPMGLGASATYYQGAGIVTKFDISGTFDGMVESSVAIESAGALTVLTV